jgi:hypothetical protein
MRGGHVAREGQTPNRNRAGGLYLRAGMARLAPKRRSTAPPREGDVLSLSRSFKFHYNHIVSSAYVCICDCAKRPRTPGAVGFFRGPVGQIHQSTKCSTSVTFPVPNLCVGAYNKLGNFRDTPARELDSLCQYVLLLLTVTIVRLFRECREPSLA